MARITALGFTNTPSGALKVGTRIGLLMEGQTVR